MSLSDKHNSTLCTFSIYYIPMTMSAGRLVRISVSGTILNLGQRHYVGFNMCIFARFSIEKIQKIVSYQSRGMRRRRSPGCDTL